jgi:hypothetical protein
MALRLDSCARFDPSALAFAMIERGLMKSEKAEKSKRISSVRVTVGGIETIATFALGNAKTTHSTRSQWRYGTNGSVAVEIAGAKAGTWYDHEAKEGGGPWELLRRKLADKDIPAWLARNLGVHLERAAGGHCG